MINLSSYDQIKIDYILYFLFIGNNKNKNKMVKNANTEKVFIVWYLELKKEHF